MQLLMIDEAQSSTNITLIWAYFSYTLSQTATSTL